MIKSVEREEFKILEGRFYGKKASVKKKGWRWDEWDWDKSYFEDEVHLRHACPHRGPADVIFKRQSKKLIIADIGEFHAMTLDVNPVPIGIHEPHGLGQAYTTQAQYAKTWFRIGHEGDRFLHCGNVSAGCVTVTDIDRWDEIYKHLILSRKDNTNIGTINILDE